MPAKVSGSKAPAPAPVATTTTAAQTQAPTAEAPLKSEKQPEKPLDWKKHVKEFDLQEEATVNGNLNHNIGLEKLYPKNTLSNKKHA